MRRAPAAAALAIVLVGGAAVAAHGDSPAYHVAMQAAPAAAARPLVAAHRGGALLWPENSLLAYRNALALGVDYLETDVHLTADGEIVILHDPTLERTTTGRGAVRASSLGALAEMRLKAADGTVTGERIPMLGELLDLLAPSSARLLLEIKAGAGREAYPGIEEKALALVKARGLLDRVVVMAFEDDTVRRVRALEPGVRTTLLVGRVRAERARAWPAEAVRWATDAGATDLGIFYRLVDAGLVQAARAAGLRVAAWTVNEEADIRRVLDLGVDLVISDRPDVVTRMLGR
ncbi:MAG TPA: glycerophosphodiester phosphodiesterase family protein [Candidatus Limnocylindria bacterium]|nr:glycerophosphodiester phosphodiesterase family protein [Candidatus Limnocylindria bacterium]